MYRNEIMNIGEFDHTSKSQIQCTQKTSQMIDVVKMTSLQRISLIW